MKNLTTELLETMGDDELVELVQNYEQLDELNKHTLSSYIKHSAINTRMHGSMGSALDAINTMSGGKDDKLKQNAKTHHDKAAGRIKGIVKATNKLTNKVVSEQTLDLINAIESGKSVEMETAFSDIMANKLVAAIDNKRNEIASQLFAVKEENNAEE